MDPIRLREWAWSDPLDGPVVADAAGVPLDRLQDLLAPLVDLRPDWGGHVRFHACGAVGEVCVGGLLVEVEPHLPVADLFALFAWTEDAALHLLDEALGAREGRPTHFAEALALGLVVECERLLRGDLHRSWERREERLLVLRGSPRFDRLGTSPPAQGVPCRYLEGTRDTLPNRLLSSGLLAACRRLGRYADALRRARPVAAALCDLATPFRPDASDFSRARERLTWRTASYRPALLLAEWVLLGRGPLAALGGGGAMGWHLDMARLFEAAVTKAVTREAIRRGWCTRVQHRDRWAVLDGEGSPYREICPDIEVLDGDHVIAVVDAKYKRYAVGGEEGAVVERLSNDDLYQLAFYGVALEARQGTAPALIIVSPADPDRPLADRWRRITVADRPLTLTGVDLALLPRWVGGVDILS